METRFLAFYCLEDRFSMSVFFSPQRSQVVEYNSNIRKQLQECCKFHSFESGVPVLYIH